MGNCKIANGRVWTDETGKARSENNTKKLKVKLSKRFVVVWIGQQVVITQRRNDNQYAKQEWNQQALESLFDELTDASRA